MSNERATIIAAAIGGICLFLAAVIGLFTPVVTRLSERMLAPTETPLPTAPPPPSPAATSTPIAPPTETPNPNIVIVVYNNFENDQDLYVDGDLKAAVDSGSYATATVTRGSHVLTNCARGKNPQVNPENCVGRTYTVDQDPFFWELPGNVTPTQANALFLIRNISSIDIDFFIDGKLSASVDRNRYVELNVLVGVHNFQACPRGMNPLADSASCGTLSRFDIENAVQSWTIRD